MADSHPSHTFLAAIVESSDDAIISKTLDGKVTSWNPSAQRLFGYTAAEMLGRPIDVLFPPDRLEEEQLILSRLQRGERVSHFETIRLHKDGTRLEVSLTLSPIRDSSGQIIGASKIARDISKQKAAERSLQETKAELAAHSAALEAVVRERTAELERLAAEAQAFSYSLTHDIRAPLRAIQGFTDLVLTEHGADLPEAAGYLRRVLRASARMDRLITDVLALSRAAQHEITLQPIDLSPLVHDIIAERPHLQPGQAEITVADPLHPVQADFASLTQILTNLLENAVKFVAKGVHPRVHVATRSHAGAVRLSVQDNGIGIAPADVPRLFTVFQRLHTQDRYEGTGLGLAIVQRAAARIGGKVGVESTPGQGSTFWVELRAADVSTAPAPDRN